MFLITNRITVGVCYLARKPQGCLQVLRHPSLWAIACRYGVSRRSFSHRFRNAFDAPTFRLNDFSFRIGADTMRRFLLTLTLLSVPGWSQQPASNRWKCRTFSPGRKFSSLPAEPPLNDGAVRSQGHLPPRVCPALPHGDRSEEHTSELQ